MRKSTRCRQQGEAKVVGERLSYQATAKAFLMKEGVWLVVAELKVQVCRSRKRHVVGGSQPLGISSNILSVTQTGVVSVSHATFVGEKSYETARYLVSPVKSYV
jgi:hypothetical protein